MKFLIVLMYSLLCAVLLNLFSQIQDLLKYLFSLGALYLGIQFFKKHDEKWMRITFVILTIILYFIAAVVYAFYRYLQYGDVPAPS
ncbi:hypothetical protein OB236_24480 [Paenibacillus sp. WQ 127069]|uniref:Uncharacterized protein n=2 Tax=Paenibacillus TaxID=44249 RepID=A0ABT2UKV6_9BACL|nr:hypothetical protein [Paenibacillus sp. WQ 127069]MCU6795270.1 hypothetical protein [Paenibacillus sp. WQ 127069]OMF14547.1 hypothetical protein BK127_17665 [Paenibacillus sp. FSL H7-0331]